MKKITTICALLCAMSILAQKQYFFTIEAGYSLENNISDFSLTQHNLNGYHIGIGFQYDLRSAQGLGIKTGIYFHNAYLTKTDDATIYDIDIRHNTKPLISLDINTSKQTIKSYGGQIPIQLVYTYSFSDNSIFISTGPSIIYRYIKYNVNAYNAPLTEAKAAKIETNYNNEIVWKSYANPLFVTYGIGFGFTIKNFVFAANYDWGLYNLIRKDLNEQYTTFGSAGTTSIHLDEKNFNLRQSELQISLGYKF